MNDLILGIKTIIGENLDAIEELVIPEEVMYNGELCKVRGIDKSALTNLPNLKKITLSNSLEYIDESALPKSKLIYNYSGDGVKYLGSADNPYLYLVKQVDSSEDEDRSLYNVTIDSNCKFSQFGAFRNCKNLQTVSFEDDCQLKNIATVMFTYCDSLKEIILPSSIETIEEDAFTFCSNLENIYINEGTKIIGASAFSYCSNLKTISIPNSVEQIGVNAFVSATNNLQYTIENNLKYLGNSTNPYLYLADVTSTTITSATINANCKFIGGAFYNCSNLESIIIPKSVKGLCGFSFSNCTNLQSVAFENGSELNTIGQGSFQNCSKLTSITLPNSVTSIGYSAFDNSGIIGNQYESCIYIATKDNPYYYLYKVSDENIVEINLHKDCKLIGKNAFKDLPKLEKIPISSDTIILDDTIFQNSSVKLIDIPDNVKFIYKEAFKGCNSLQELRVPFIGQCIQNGPSYLADLFDKLDMPKSLNTLVIKNDVEKLYEDALWGLSLCDIIFEGNIQDIEEGAFSGCDKCVIYSKAKSKPEDWDNNWNASFINNKLPVVWDYPNNDVADTGYIYKVIDNIRYAIKDDEANICNAEVISSTPVVLPDTIIYKGKSYDVTSIGYRAFRNCDSLTSVEIPSSVTNIDEEAFDGCSSLTSIEIPDSVKIIDWHAFSSCDKLTSVVIGDGVESISSYAFSSCAKLASIDVAESNPNYKSIDGNLYSKDGTTLIQYAPGKTATEFTIPSSVTSIGNYAFDGCTSLTSIEIPNSVKSISSYAFNNCSKLTSVTIGNSVTSIGAYAFRGCTLLANVTIPNSVTSIGANVFENCNNLQYTIENNLKYLGNSTNLYLYLAGVTSTGISTATVNANCKIIGNCVFKDCSSLTSITIPNSVTYIGGDVFENCNKLQEITLPFVGATRYGTEHTNFGYLFGGFGSYSNDRYVPSSLKTVTITDGAIIDEYAFYDCSNLTSVTIGNTITSIGNYAFENCSSLTSVIIGNTVTSIGNRAFDNCSSLTNITIGESVTSIGEYAFNNCNSLTKVNYLGTIDQWAEIEFILQSNPTCYAKDLYINNELVTEAKLTTATKISNCAFQNCSSLTSIVIPRSVTSIGWNAFEDCSSLTNVIIPSTVTSVDYKAFGNCTSLKVIYCEAMYKPDTWDYSWNLDCGAEIVWNYKKG